MTDLDRIVDLVMVTALGIALWTLSVVRFTTIRPRTRRITARVA